MFSALVDSIVYQRHRGIFLNRARYAALTIISLLNARNKSSKPSPRVLSRAGAQTAGQGAGDTPIDEDARQRNLSALNVIIQRGDISSPRPERSSTRTVTWCARHKSLSFRKISFVTLATSRAARMPARIKAHR